MQNSRAPSEILVSQDSPSLPPWCAQVLVPVLEILAQGGCASPCCSPQSSLEATPNPHLGGRARGGGGGQLKGVDKQTG